MTMSNIELEHDANLQITFAFWALIFRIDGTSAHKRPVDVVKFINLHLPRSFANNRTTNNKAENESQVGVPYSLLPLFHSCIFHPCNFVRIAFSTPAFSVPPQIHTVTDATSHLTHAPATAGMSNSNKPQTCKIKVKR